MDGPHTPDEAPSNSNAADRLIFKMHKLIKASDTMTKKEQSDALKNLFQGGLKNGVNMRVHVGRGFTPILYLIIEYTNLNLTDKQRLMILQLVYTLVNDGELNEEYTKLANAEIRSLSEFVDLTALKKIINHHFESRKQLLAMIEGVDTLPRNLDRYAENEEDLRMRFLTSQAREIAPFMMTKFPTLNDVKRNPINEIPRNDISTTTATTETTAQKLTSPLLSIKSLSSFASLSPLSPLLPPTPPPISSVKSNKSKSNKSSKTQKVKVCPEGKIINPDTGRCIKIKTAKPKANKTNKSNKTNKTQKVNQKVKV